MKAKKKERMTIGDLFAPSVLLAECGGKWPSQLTRRELYRVALALSKRYDKLETAFLLSGKRGGDIALANEKRVKDAANMDRNLKRFVFDYLDQQGDRPNKWLHSKAIQAIQNNALLDDRSETTIKHKVNEYAAAWRKARGKGKRRG